MVPATLSLGYRQRKPSQSWKHVQLDIRELWLAYPPRNSILLSLSLTSHTHMSLALKKVLGKLHFRVPPRRKKTANENIQLVQDARGGPTPTPAVDALELELAEERVKRARLEDEYQRAQAKATEVKRKLEDEIHQVKELLEARERDEARKDASLQRLDEAMNEMHTQVCQVENGVDPIADVFYVIPHEACQNGPVAFGEDNGTERRTGVPHQVRRDFRGRGGGRDREPEHPYQLRLRCPFVNLGPTRTRTVDECRRA